MPHDYTVNESKKYHHRQKIKVEEGLNIQVLIFSINYSVQNDQAHKTLTENYLLVVINQQFFHFQ